MGRSKTDDQLSILVLNKKSWLNPEPGGAEVNLGETVERLAQKGHDIHVLVGAEDHDPQKDHSDRITFHRVGVSNLLPAPWDLISTYVTLSLLFYWYLFKISPQVVYTVNSPLPWPVFTSQPRVVIYHHIAIKSFFQTHSFPQNVLGSFAQMLGVFRDRNATTISVSPSTTRQLVLRGHDPDTVHEIKNGISLADYDPKPPADVPRIVYLGGLEKYKGVDRIPSIHTSLNRMLDDPIQLDIAGRDGPVREVIKDYCENTESASFHGYVSKEKKKSLLQDARVFIAPSRVEGWGIAVLEANACGTPAVGSDVSGLRDSILDGETGVLSDARDPEAFANDIKTLLEDDELRDTYGKRAREWAEEHSWETAADDLEKVFYAARSRK